MDERQRRRHANIAKVAKDGPALRYDQNTWIEARRPGQVLVGGLGALGVGSMWVAETERHRQDPTYTDAPEAWERAGRKEEP